MNSFQIFIYLFCCFISSIKSDCFPQNYSASCQCFESGVVRINYLNLSVKKAKRFFQKLSLSNCSKSYERLDWSIVSETSNQKLKLLDYLFGAISFQEILIKTLGEIRLTGISPNAFLNQKTRKNNYTESLALSIDLGVLPKNLFDEICTQLISLEVFILRGNGYLRSGTVFGEKVFSACKNTPIKTLRLKNINEFLMLLF